MEDKFFRIFIIGILLLVSTAFAERLPTVNGDTNQWGTILNNFLNVSINPDGSLKNNSIIIDRQNITNSGFFQNGTESITVSLPASNITGNFSSLNVTSYLNASQLFGDFLGTWFLSAQNFFQNGTESITTNLPASNISGLDNSHIHDTSNITTGTLSTSRLPANVSMLGQNIEDVEVDNDITIDTTKDLKVKGNVFVNGTIYTINLTALNQSNINVNGTFFPVFDNLFNLGAYALRWATIFAATINATTLQGNLQGTWYAQQTSFFQNGTESITTSLPAGNITGLSNSHTHDITNITGDYGGTLNNKITLAGGNITSAVATSTNALNVGNQPANFFHNGSSTATCTGSQKLANASISATGALTGNCGDDATGSGSPTTSLPAENITSGTIDDRRLSSNVSFTNINQTIIADKNFTGSVRINSLLSGTNITGAVPNSNQLSGNAANFFLNLSSLPSNDSILFGGKNSNFYFNGTPAAGASSLPASNITGGTFPQYYVFINTTVFSQDINVTQIARINLTYLGFGNNTINNTANYKLFVNGDVNVTGIINGTNILAQWQGLNTNFFQNSTPAAGASSLPASNITGGTFPQFYTFANVTVVLGLNITDILNGNRTFLGMLGTDVNNTADYKLYAKGSINVTNFINASGLIVSGAAVNSSANLTVKDGNLVIQSSASANNSQTRWIDTNGKVVALQYWNGTALILNVTG